MKVRDTCSNKKDKDNIRLDIITEELDRGLEKQDNSFNSISINL